MDLKKLSNTVSKKIVKKVVCNNLNTKVNDLENKIPGVSSLIQTNQYKTDQKSLEKKIWILGKKKKIADKKLPDIRQKTKKTLVCWVATWVAKNFIISQSNLTF